jgi:multiple sugar transport system substrate-binding protein
MDDTVKQTGPRITLIIITVLVVGAITVGSELLLRDIEPGWGPVPVLHMVVTAIMVVLSGLCVGLLPIVITRIWQQPPLPKTYDEFLTRLKNFLKRPARVTMSVVATGAIVFVGLWIRPENPGLEPGPLRIMTAFPADPGDARSMLIDQWNRLNPDNHVEFEIAPLDADGQHERMVKDAQLGKDQTVDIYVLDIVWMAEFASRGYIRPLDRSRVSERDLGDFVTKVMETCDFDGNLWALPFNSDAGLIYRRTGIPGVRAPQNWDDYFGAAAKAARTSHPELDAANAAQLAPNDEMLTVTAFEAIWAAGGQLVAPNGQLLLTPDGSKVAFSNADKAGIKKLAAAAHDSDITLTREGEVFETTATVATQTFIDGRTAYMRNWPVARDVIGDKVSYDVSVPPVASVLGGQNLAIASGTDKPRAAQALIQFLTNPSSQLIISEVGGFVPTRQSAFDNSRRPDTAEVQSALNQARLRPVTASYPECSQVFREGITSSFGLNGELPAGFEEELARACA